MFVGTQYLTQAHLNLITHILSGPEYDTTDPDILQCCMLDFYDFVMMKYGCGYPAIMTVSSIDQQHFNHFNIL